MMSRMASIMILISALIYILYLQEINSNLLQKVERVEVDYSTTELEFMERVFYLENLLLSNNALQKELKCLAENIYHEARSESRSGQLAVATVTLNRVMSDNFPKTICGVVYQRNRKGCQFSWVCNSNHAIRNKKAYQNALNVAETVLLFGVKHAKIDDAVFYHAYYVDPAWSTEKNYVARVDSHLFYTD